MKKNPLRLLVLLIYLVLVLVSLAIVIKPGAAIFRYRHQLQPAEIKPDAGYAYRYLVELNTRVFQPQGAVLFENNRQLASGSSNQLTEQGGGLFYMSDPQPYGTYVYFAASDNTDPRTNERVYTLYLPVLFLSRSMGSIYLVVFSLGLCWYLFGVFAPTRRRAFQVSFKKGGGELLNPISKPHVLSQSHTPIWKNLLLWMLLAAYVYIGFEWLFFATKPSFMDTMLLIRKLELVLQAGFFLAFPMLVMGSLLWLISRLLVNSRWNNFVVTLAALLPAATLAGIILLLVDNFTYTLFGSGIVTAQGPWRGVYGAGFLLGVLWLQRWILGALGLMGRHSKVASPPGYRVMALGGLFVLSLALVVSGLDFASNSGDQAMTVSSRGGQKPNIILLGGDGLDATRLSAYGYERDTTPTLTELAAEALVAENAFPNAAHSGGSVISILTSKLPTQTRVLYPPDILQEKDAYQHLPGILKREGYHTVELGVLHYVDAYTMNLRDGFDLVNNRSAGEAVQFRFLQGRGIDNAVYFASLLVGRITERLNHIFYIKKMVNPIDKVIAPSEPMEDEGRVDKLVEMINATEEPFFVHMHLMGTHGPEFFPYIQKYSLGQTQHEFWMPDFYDDAVLSFDAHLRRVVESLEQTGKLDDTILVVYTDHGMGYRVNVRIPLIIRFPQGEHAGRIQANVQNLDIAPTLLDYLGLPIPDWMGGLSLLQDNFPTDRMIFGTGAAAIQDDYLVAEQVKPPFYQFGYFNLIHCNQWYQVHVVWDLLSTGEIEGHTAPCNAGAMLSQDQFKKALVDHLAENGFDVSTLK